MAEKIADAYVEVHLDDKTGDTNRIFQKIETDADRSGGRAGDLMSRTFLRNLSKVTAPATALFRALPLAMIGSAGPAIAGAAAAFGVLTLAVGDSLKALDLYQQGLIDPKKMKMFHAQMALMTADQRAFTMMIITQVGPALDKLKATASANLLGGLTTGIKGALTLMPILNAAVGSMASIMGTTFARLGALFQSSGFQQNLDKMLISFNQLTAAAGNVLVQLTARLVQFGVEMAPVTAALARFIEHVGNGMVGAMDKLAPHAESFARIWDALGRIVEILLPLFAQLAGELADLLAPILEAVAGFLERNKGALEAIIPPLAGVILAMKGLSILTSVLKWFKALFVVVGTLSRVLGPAATALGRLAVSVGGLVSKAGGLGTIAGHLAKFGLAAAGVAAVAAAFVKLDEIFNGGTTFDALNDLGDTINKILSPLQTIKAELDVMAATWSERLTAIRAKWDETWAAVETFLRTTWENITTFISEKVEAVRLFIEEKLTAIQTKWNEIWLAVETFIRTTWENITTFISEKAEAVRLFIEEKLTAIQTKWNEIWLAVETFLRTTWENITTFLTEKAEVIRAFIEEKLIAIQTKWNEIWAAVETFIRTTWENISTFVSEKAEAIRAFIEEKITAVKTKWDEIWKAVEDFFRTTWENIQNIVTTIAGAIESFIVSWAERIRAAIQSVIDLFNSAPGAGGARFGSDPGASEDLNPGSAFGNRMGGIIGARAKGGATSGLTMVGEHGPELVRLPGGSSVYGNAMTSGMMNRSGGNGSSGGGSEVQFAGNLDGAFATAFMYLVRTGQIRIKTS